MESIPKGPLGTDVWRHYEPTDLGSCNPESQGKMSVNGLSVLALGIPCTTQDLPPGGRPTPTMTPASSPCLREQVNCTMHSPLGSFNTATISNQEHRSLPGAWAIFETVCVESPLVSIDPGRTSWPLWCFVFIYVFVYLK